MTENNYTICAICGKHVTVTISDTVTIKPCQTCITNVYNAGINDIMNDWEKSINATYTDAFYKGSIQTTNERKYSMSEDIQVICAKCGNLLIITDIEDSGPSHGKRVYVSACDTCMYLTDQGARRDERIQFEDDKEDQYELGVTTDRTEGYNEGYDDGKKEELSEGNNSGYRSGRSIGYTEGKDDGYKNGYREGYDDAANEHGNPDS